jgi:hypothetical protein
VDASKALTGSFTDNTPAVTGTASDGTATAAQAAVGGKVALTLANVTDGDLVKFTVAGGTEQTFTVNGQTTAAQLATAINNDNTLKLLVSAADVSGKLVLTSVDAAKALTGSFTDNTPAYSDSAPSSHDVISNFVLTTDKLDLPETTVLTGAYTAVQTGVANLSIASISNGVVTFGGTAAATASVSDMVKAVFTAMGSNKATAAIVFDNGHGGVDSYILQGDGVAGVQDSDIMVALVGVHVTNVSAIIM